MTFMVPEVKAVTLTRIAAKGAVLMRYVRLVFVRLPVVVATVFAEVWTADTASQMFSPLLTSKVRLTVEYVP
jgi:hypothetical protein